MSLATKKSTKGEFWNSMVNQMIQTRIDICQSEKFKGHTGKSEVDENKENDA